jgi:hypothetical protein
MCQEYILSDFKQLLEHIMIGNMDADNFPDCVQLARTFDCKVLREAIYKFGNKHYQELYRKGQLKTLNKLEFTLIKGNH